MCSRRQPCPATLQVAAEARRAYLRLCRLLPQPLANTCLATQLSAMSARDSAAQRSPESASAAIALLADGTGLLLQPQSSPLVSLLVDGWAGDADFTVRAALADRLPAVAAGWVESVRGQQLLDKFLALAADPIWRVRQAAAQRLSDVAAAAPQHVQELASVVQERLSKDVSMWVREACKEQLGALICATAAAAAASVTPPSSTRGGGDDDSPAAASLAAATTSAAEVANGSSSDGDASQVGGSCSSSSQAAADAAAEELLRLFAASVAEAAATPPPCNLAVAMAASLPSVAEATGPARWPQLRPAFETLSRSDDLVVVGTVVGALPRLLAAIPPDVAAADVAPAAQELLERHGGSAEVTMALVPVFGRLAAAAPPGLQAVLLPLLPRLAPPPEERPGEEHVADWRSRRLVASQLSQTLRACCRPEHAAELVLPATGHLCRDPVWAVRVAAVEQAAAMLVHLSGCSEQLSKDSAAEQQRLLDLLLDDVATMAESSDYQSRLAFVELCNRVPGAAAAATHGAAAAGSLSQEASALAAPPALRQRLLSLLALLASDPLVSVRSMATACLVKLNAPPPA